MADRDRFTRELRATDPEETPDVSSVLAALYEELRTLAGAYMRRERADHTLQPTALVHEAYARLVDATQLPWDDAAHFRAIAARVMRQVLVDHARKHGALKRGGDRLRVTFAEGQTPAPEQTLDVLELDEALEALRALHERKARVVALLFFGGLTHEEASRVLGVSRKTVEADWYMARAWLGARMDGEGHA